MGASLDRLRPAVARSRAALRRAVAVDPRALAALRIALGGLLLVDLLLRSRDLVAFYTDAGVLPRALLRQQFGRLAALAFVHDLSGAAWFEGVLFVVAGAVALALLLGYRTRLATAVSLVLLVSLQLRDPLVLNGGDAVLRRLLFWGLFLPLGGCWSVDAARTGRRLEPVASVASAALLVQVVLVYLVNGLLKLRGPAWVSGQAVRVVFHLDALTVRFGDLLAGFPHLLELVDWLWLALLLGSVLLLVLRGPPRAALAGAFATVHLGMFLTMRLGLFPFVSMAALVPFLQAPVWDAAQARLGPSIDLLRRRASTLVASPPIRPALDGLARGLPERPRPPSPTPLAGAFQGTARRSIHGFVALALAFVLLWNAASLGVVTAPAAVTHVVDPAQRRWDMFAPQPRTDDGWYVVPGELASGGTVDAFHGGPVTWDRPPELARTFPSHRWFVYLLHLPGSGTAPLRAGFADYLCRRWNGAHDDRLVAVHVYYLLEPARADGSGPVQRVDLGRYGCPAG